MRTFSLFVDELGISNPLAKQSEIYVLCGCAVEDSSRESLKNYADHIKFKYWGKTGVVFHSREIGRKEGDFSIFKGQRKLFDNFISDLFSLLKESSLNVFACVVDMKDAKGLGWNSIKVERETAKKIFYHFIAWLLGMGETHGKITIEMATAEKDRYYLQEFAYFLSPGAVELPVDYKKVQQILTSISFVTKKNHDIEQQLADLFAYAIRCKYMRISKKEIYKAGSYEARLIKILEKKLFKKPNIAREHKMKFYKTIDAFCILPKT